MGVGNDSTSNPIEERHRVKYSLLTDNMARAQDELLQLRFIFKLDTAENPSLVQAVADAVKKMCVDLGIQIPTYHQQSDVLKPHNSPVVMLQPKKPRNRPYHRILEVAPIDEANYTYQGLHDLAKETLRFGQNGDLFLFCGMSHF